MKSLVRNGLLGLAGLGLAFLFTGSQIQKYRFPRTKFGPNEGRLKIYKDKSPEEIKKLMQVMSDDIGVKCAFCHDEKDYASEENPMKDFARRKMFMLDWMNAKYKPLEAKWEYSCYTCHRGQVTPVPSSPPGAAGPAKGK